MSDLSACRPNIPTLTLVTALPVNETLVRQGFCSGIPKSLGISVWGLRNCALEEIVRVGPVQILGSFSGSRSKSRGAF